ncbi:sugar phosphate isomerase/epimerase family protein [Streptosporangium sp. DT93]|uniref:sugar phosphate isomerase/epimerase family protein n=1 Tax=Streptosporangium sp. DT93 TaxID=3393428 RepID=UPI003CF221B1
MTLLGVSTSVLPRREDLEDLLVYEPDVVEFYNYPSELLPGVERFCARHGIRPALHTPTPYDEPEPLRRFAPTGPDPEGVSAAMRLTERTVRYAARVGALHVVVHFPSPYPPFTTAGFAGRCERFLRWLSDLARDQGVPVLLENLSANPLLRDPDQYGRLMRAHPGLGFCLDLGHAHLMGARGDPLAYARALAGSVRSMHVYNTTADRYAEHGHELARPEQSARDGYLDLSHVIPALLGHTSPRVLILEHTHAGVGAGDAARSAGWLRDLLKERDPPGERDAPREQDPPKQQDPPKERERNAVDDQGSS